MSERLREFVLVLDDISDSDRVVLIRRVIEHLRGECPLMQTDIPLSIANRWPSDVVAAGQRLARVADGNDAYRVTKTLHQSDEELWAGFVAVAPYAFDASMWNAESHARLHLADEGQSVAGRLPYSALLDLAIVTGDAMRLP